MQVRIRCQQLQVLASMWVSLGALQMVWVVSQLSTPETENGFP